MCESTSQIDVLSYVVFTGFEFVSICVITRGCRSWAWRILAIVMLAALDVSVERWWNYGGLPLEQWLAICFTGNFTVVGLLIFGLSRDSIGRRLFLSITFGSYSVCLAAAFHLLAYRNVLGVSKVSAILLGLGAAVEMYLLFLFWVLPRMPKDVRVVDWREPFVLAFVMFVALFASGIWPVSVYNAPVRYCVPFMVVAVAAWVVFPVFCRMNSVRLHAIKVQHELERMMDEVKVRRTAIDEARRMLHDRRFDRVQIGDYLLRGRCDKALEYLRALDADAAEVSTLRLVWCENETLNAILSGASRRAAAKGVGFEVNAEVDRVIALPDVEIVAVVANVIDNAVTAAEKFRELGSGQQRMVRVNLRQRELGIGVTVSNPVPEGFALSAKGMPCEDADIGIGLESVRRVVGRRRGEWAYELSDGWLTCRVVLMFG